MVINNNIHGKNNTFNRQNTELYNLSLYDTYIECVVNCDVSCARDI